MRIGSRSPRPPRSLDYPRSSGQTCCNRVAPIRSCRATPVVLLGLLDLIHLEAGLFLILFCCALAEVLDPLRYTRRLRPKYCEDGAALSRLHPAAQTYLAAMLFHDALA